MRYDHAGPPLAPEAVVDLVAPGGMITTWLCTAQNLEDLAVGWLIGEGRAADPAEIGPLTVDEAGLRVSLGAPGFDLDRPPIPPPADVRRGGRALDHLVANPAEFRSMFETMFAGGTLRDLTGGVHTGALVSAGAVMLVREDVSRHCVVDKLLGAAFREGRPLAEAVVLLSGRISGALAAKGARTGVCAMATMSIPTTLAAAIAGVAGVTLIGRARSATPHIYPPAAP